MRFVKTGGEVFDLGLHEDELIAFDFDDVRFAGDRAEIGLPLG